VEVWLHELLPSALHGSVWSDSDPGHFILEVIAPGTHQTGGWVGGRGGLDPVEKTKKKVPSLSLMGFESRSVSP